MNAPFDGKRFCDLPPQNIVKPKSSLHPRQNEGTLSKSKQQKEDTSYIKMKQEK